MAAGLVQVGFKPIFNIGKNGSGFVVKLEISVSGGKKGGGGGKSDPTPNIV